MSFLCPDFETFSACVELLTHPLHVCDVCWTLGFDTGGFVV